MGIQHPPIRYSERLAKLGTVPSSGSIGDSFCNALANAILDYLEIFHNRQRRHSSIGMLTPIEYENLHHNRSIA